MGSANIRGNDATSCHKPLKNRCRKSFLKTWIHKNVRVRKYVFYYFRMLFWSHKCNIFLKFILDNKTLELLAFFPLSSDGKVKIMNSFCMKFLEHFEKIIDSFECHKSTRKSEAHDSIIRIFWSWNNFAFEATIDHFCVGTTIFALYKISARRTDSYNGIGKF